MAFLFWFSVMALAYTFAGYPALIAFLARAARRTPVKQAPKSLPPVSVVLVVYNEAERLRARLENLLESDYLNLQIVVTSDGSIDETESVLKALGDSRVTPSIRKERNGKAACLNHS